MVKLSVKVLVQPGIMVDVQEMLGLIIIITTIVIEIIIFQHVILLA